MNPNDLPLGKAVACPAVYDPGLLCPIARAPARGKIGIGAETPCYGVDRWTAYELSWLGRRGKPEVAVGEFFFAASTPAIIESKSMKLYLNSYNQSRFASAAEVQRLLEEDLGRAVGGVARVRLVPPGEFQRLQISVPEGECLDGIDIAVDSYRVAPELLRTERREAGECLHSNLLRTTCPVTGQPDWATVVISYRGKKIRRPELLAYLISYREHSGFHENCVEKIYVDILRHCGPRQLLVQAFFTRRGGIDINPCRSTSEVTVEHRRLPRQ